MDTHTFVLELIRALVWPVTILLVIVLLRPSLLELLPALRRFRYRDFEVEFERKLAELAARADEAQVPRAKDVRARRAEVRESVVVPELIESVAQRSPRAAVAEAWRLLRTAVDQDRGDLPATTRAIVSELNALHDRVVHDQMDITPGQALQYAVLAQRLIDAMIPSDRKSDRR